MIYTPVAEHLPIVVPTTNRFLLILVLANSIAVSGVLFAVRVQTVLRQVRERSLSREVLLLLPVQTVLRSAGLRGCLRVLCAHSVGLGFRIYGLACVSVRIAS
jgi:hypothetical protein